MSTMTLRELIFAYWDLAYREGKDGRDYDTPNGEAQSVWNEINSRIGDMERNLSDLALQQTGRGVLHVTAVDESGLLYVHPSGFVKPGDKLYTSPFPQQAAESVDQHPDDAAVDAFATAMKSKLADARAKGRGGWNNDEPGMQQRLSNLLRTHVEKGDPRDVANFAMFLHQRGESILPKPEQSNYPEIPDSSNPEQAVGDGVVTLPPIVREVLEWYASAPTIWVGWNEAGWAEEEAAKASGHYTFIGEDDRGHNQYVPNHVRAEEALDALTEWQESLALPAVATPAEVTEEMAAAVLTAYRAEVGTVAPLDLMPIDTEAMRVALAAQPSAVGVPDGRPGSERVVSVGELEALCDEWEAEVRLRSYTEARPLLEELRTLIAKAGVE